MQAIGCNILRKVSFFSKISYKNQKLAKQKRRKKTFSIKKKPDGTLKDRRQDLIEPNSVSKTEPNIPQSLEYPPDERLYLLDRKFT